ncbi:ras guanine nucleotide exchange factor domain-containing protein [Mycotypha africana]|uniref:ras guanine nucleotide exchange factor domain-containing protein n=1 Tax=Mycotypha africana TaxID=64632 RepID=UPI00230165F7|nr:ras guanine nucleotide exchange factor domain-containing protein [Mycotypha africana]KAI8970474.1 ras guanine nucleotide exchange factor domain-containing protein [Mycotypha africana]
MLMASSNIDKEVGYMKSNSILRTHHRAMMASMSKLVLTTRISTFTFLTEEEQRVNVNKILSEASELLLSARNFVNTCQSLSIPLIETDPQFIMEADAHRDDNENKTPFITPLTDRKFSTTDDNSSQYSLQLNLVESLETIGNRIQDSVETIIRTINNCVLPTSRKNISNNNKQDRISLIASLFTHFRNLSSQTSLFIGYLTEMNFSPVQNQKGTVHIEKGKQELTKYLGLLFFYLQALTADNTLNDSHEEHLNNIRTAAHRLIDPITLICESVLVQAAKVYGRQNSDASLNLPLDKSQSIRKKASTSFVMDMIIEDANEITYSNAEENDPSIINVIEEEEEEESDQKLSVSSIEQCRSGQSSSQASSITSLSLQKSLSNKSTAAAKKVKRFFSDDYSVSEKSSLNQSITATESDSSTIINYTPPNTADENNQRPFYLRYDYGLDDIVFNAEGGVKGGTLPALVERLTLHDYLDMNFVNTFLLTYRSFCTSVELLDLLEARYNLECPDGLSEDERDIWAEKKVKLVRLRVFNVLKNWLDLYFHEDDSLLLDRLYNFTQTHIKKTLTFSNGQLESLIERRRNPEKYEENINGGLKRMILTLPDPPEPILPKNMRRIRLLEVDPLEMARQLTIMDFTLYSAIRPIECLDKSWSKDEEGNVAINIRASIDYCNQITTWVSDVILSHHDIKKRSVLIKYWVQVAEKCRCLNNFNTCMAILSAFDNSSVGRLKRTWEIVGARTNQTLQQIRKLMGANRNFIEYRALIHSINPPCIPFLGIYLQDLTFIEDGNSNVLKQSKNLINFAKRAKTAEVIREIQQYQSSLYQLKPVKELQEYIRNNLISTRDEEQLYKESLRLEPREREDEKITRLLQESGFL